MCFSCFNTLCRAVLISGSIGSEFLILVVIYVLAFYMRKYPVQYFEKHALFIFCTSLLLNIAIAMAAGKYLDYTIEAWQAKLLSKFATNNNPLVIISSVSLFFYIKNLKTYRFRSIADLPPICFLFILFIVVPLASENLKNYYISILSHSYFCPQFLLSFHVVLQNISDRN